jgi:hypothetical protein
MTIPIVPLAAPNEGLPFGCKPLRTCDPAWLRGMRRGAALILGGVGMALLGVIVGVVTLAASRRHEPSSALVVFLLASYLMNLVGSWMLTEPEPGLATQTLGVARTIIRFSLLIGLMNSVFNIALGGQQLAPQATVIVALVGAGAMLASIASSFAQLWYVRQLALRIPNRFLATRAMALLWGVVTCVAAIVFLAVFMAYCSAQMRQTIGTFGLLQVCAFFASVLMFCVICCAVVLGIMYLILLARLAVALGREANLAEQASGSIASA